MFSGAPRRQQSFGGVALSLALHLVLIGGVIRLSGLASSIPRVARPHLQTFIVFPAMPAFVVRNAAVAPMPHPTVATPRDPDQPPLQIREIIPPPLPSTALDRADPPAPSPLVARPELVPGRLAVLRPPDVVIGAFAGAPALASSPEPAGEVRTAGFDTAPATAPSWTDSRPGSDRQERSVALAGFATTVPGLSTASPTFARSVASVGFGTTPIQPDATRSARAVVKDSGFNAPAPAAPPPDAPRPQQIDTPVEVLSKPAPEYTSEARELKLEGEVFLEVAFMTTGQVRVVRVVRGLGHGLDEAAVRAAERIQFKPARSGGRSVDFRTTVHIVFRLA
jgi:TonB family protein